MSNQHEPSELSLASDLLAETVLEQLTSPALCLPRQLLERTAREQGGGYAISVPARRQPFQLPQASPLFLGVTSELRSDERESHHFHPHNWEVYCLLTGSIRMKTFLGFCEKEFILNPGDILICPAGSCHHLCEWVEPGVCYVFRAPNDIIGEAAKIPCDGSIHRRKTQQVLHSAA